MSVIMCSALKVKKGLNDVLCNIWEGGREDWPPFSLQQYWHAVDFTCLCIVLSSFVYIRKWSLQSFYEICCLTSVTCLTVQYVIICNMLFFLQGCSFSFLCKMLPLVWNFEVLIFKKKMFKRNLVYWKKNWLILNENFHSYWASDLKSFCREMLCTSNWTLNIQISLIQPTQN